MVYLIQSLRLFNRVKTCRTVRPFSSKIGDITRKMGYTKPAIVVTTLVICTAIATYFCYALFMKLFSYMDDNGSENLVDNWIFRLLLNLLGYGTVILPGCLLYYYVRNTHLVEQPDRSCLINFLRNLYYDDMKKGYESLDDTTRPPQTTTFLQDALRLLFCSVGLLASYLIWGLEQERIMTQEYRNSAGDSCKFKDSQYLVFVNRILAMMIAGGYNMMVRQPRHSVPYYKYLYCSFSNVMSSWCQYEALKFISFPAQVISKTCKIIPVMLMGKIVSKRKYGTYEYVVAVLICLGMVMFLMGSPDAVTNTSNQTVTTFSGIILIVGYMTFDSFTSNWQSELFTNYSVTSMQMMFGVNLFSALLTTVSLIQQGSFVNAFDFSLRFPQFLFDCVYLSICSAVGQLFVYYTISCFGPVVFIIIMTVRQGVAIVLSCITYQHFVDMVGVSGILVVFFAIFLRTYYSQRAKRAESKRRSPARSSSA